MTTQKKGFVFKSTGVLPPEIHDRVWWARRSHRVQRRWVWCPWSTGYIGWHKRGQQREEPKGSSGTLYFPWLKRLAGQSYTPQPAPAQWHPLVTTAKPFPWRALSWSSPLPQKQEQASLYLHAPCILQHAWEHRSYRCCHPPEPALPQNNPDHEHREK